MIFKDSNCLLKYYFSHFLTIILLFPFYEKPAVKIFYATIFCKRKK